MKIGKNDERFVATIKTKFLFSFFEMGELP
jgi:hypothetical protein